MPTSAQRFSAYQPSRLALGFALCVALCIGVVAWPADLAGQLLVALTAIPAYLSPTAADNAGNSTAILMTSALASLLWLRADGSNAAALLVSLLGILAGFGA